MAFQLILNNQSFFPEQLLQPGLVVPVSEQQQSVLNFVREWLRGQEFFTVHTSGSTGTPKAISVSRQRMQTSARLTLTALGIESADMAVLCIHAGYIGGKMMLVRAMEGDLPIIVLEPGSSPLKTLPAGVHPLFAALVPLQLQAILQDPVSLTVLNAMKAVIIGGAAPSAALEEAAQQVQAPIYSTYGMTETVSHIALRRINGPNRQDYFQVLPQISISTDSRGCLVIDRAVTEAPVVTNDRVELMGDGKFRWLGRADNTINSGGVKVQAEQIEALAEALLTTYAHPRRVLAGGVADEKLGEKVVLLVEGAPLSPDLDKYLREHLLEQLPAYWTPKDIIYKKSFVESDNGKVKRKETWMAL